MLLDNAINKTKFLVMAMVVISLLFLVSIITNFFLAGSLFYIKDKTNIVVLPMDHSSKYEFKNDKYDIRYLQDMGISFISLRLNNTPETVHKKHQLLLSYVDIESRPSISAILSDEEKIIIKDDLTSAFYYDEINVYPEYDVFEVKGLLKTWSGTRPIKDQNKTYQLKVNYVNGQFVIKNFVEVKND